MTKEEIRDQLRLADKLLDKLPEGAEMIDIMIGSQVQLYGKFDFRKFAESNGAQVKSHLYKDNIHMMARVFGLDLVHMIDPDYQQYAQELQRCVPW